MENVEILPEDFKKHDFSFKIIIIGDSETGKSCLSSKASLNSFMEAYNPTVGFKFFNLNIKMNKNVIKLQIWDICGQEIYKSLTSDFYIIVEKGDSQSIVYIHKFHCCLGVLFLQLLMYRRCRKSKQTDLVIFFSY